MDCICSCLVIKTNKYFKKRHFFLIKLRNRSLTIFWLFPISFILGLTSIQSLSQHFTFLQYFLNTSFLIRSFIQNILPTLLVTLFMSFLPWILLGKQIKIANRERELTVKKKII